MLLLDQATLPPSLLPTRSCFLLVVYFGQNSQLVPLDLVEGRWDIEAGFGAGRKDNDDVDDYDDEEGVFLSLGPTLLRQFNRVLTLR